MTNKPSRRSIRLHGYDYSQQRLYYITICMQDRLKLFGEVITGEVVLNEVGEHTQECWLNIPNHFPNVIVHDYIIMPNHIHGIIEIVGAKHLSPVINIMRANHHLPLRGTSKTIGSIVRGFKIGVTKYVREHTDIYDVWQRNYYEHIIRDGNDYARIAEYIQDNPLNWADDEYNV